MMHYWTNGSTPERCWLYVFQKNQKTDHVETFCRRLKHWTRYCTRLSGFYTTIRWDSAYCSWVLKKILFTSLQNTWNNFSFISTHKVTGQNVKWLVGGWVRNVLKFFFLWPFAKNVFGEGKERKETKRKRKEEEKQENKTWEKAERQRQKQKNKSVKAKTYDRPNSFSSSPPPSPHGERERERERERFSFSSKTWSSSSIPSIPHTEPPKYRHFPLNHTIVFRWLILSLFAATCNDSFATLKRFLTLLFWF